MADDRHEGVERWSPTQAWLYSTIASNPRSNRLIVSEVDPGPNDVVMDIGCGAGAAVRAAARTGATAIGIDPSVSMVRYAQRRSRTTPNARFLEGHAAHLPFDDDSVTVGLAISTYHHWPDGEAGLREVMRVLAAGGRMLVAERRLRKGDGHGLSPAEAEALASQMRSIGFGGVEVRQRRVRVLTLMLVSGVA